MAKRFWSLCVPLGCCVLAASCRVGATEEDKSRVSAEAHPVDDAPHYSPFVVAMSGNQLAFDQVTFKDVGLSLPAEERAFVYEAFADSVRHGLASEGMASTVRYDTQWSDPAEHLYCAGHHVYVDLWHAAGSEEWGYSLWSGCGEASEFGRGTVQASADPVDAAQPVANDIARQLRAAVERNCFTKHC